MRLRKWEYKDILSIAELEKECFPDGGYSFGQLASAFDAETFCGIVAIDGDEVIGYAAATAVADSADLEKIAVAEAYRGGGIGKSLLKELCKALLKRGVEKVFLEVRVSNAAAMKMYLSCGFKGVYARTRYYPDGEDCLVMAKEL